VKNAVIIILILTVCSGCRTTLRPSEKVVCPDLDSIFPVNRKNFREFLDFNTYDTVVKVSIVGTPTMVARDTINNISIALSKDNYDRPEFSRLVIGQTVGNVSRSYEIVADTIKYFSTGWSRDGRGFKIGRSRTYADGFGEHDHDKGYKICWKEALAIGELNLEKFRNQKGYQKTMVQRQESYLKPLWIFTVKYENGRKKFFTVDGITGEFKKSSFFDIYPNAVKGVKQKKK